MPYIAENKRTATTRFIPQNAGELNYAITLLIQEYIRAKGLKYQHINDIMGALEGAKLEFYARVVRPYEDKKMAENGDVFTQNIS